MNAIFVYGLLKPGLSLHHVAEPFVVRSAPARVTGRLYNAGVPAARFGEDGEIEGFVFWLDETRLDEALAVLDELEDEGDQYKRIVVSATTDNGDVEAFAYDYLLQIEPESFVGGVWR